MAEPILGIPLTLADRVHQIFPTLTEAQIARIAGHGRKRPVQPGEVLLNLGDQLRFFVEWRQHFALNSKPTRRDPYNLPRRSGGYGIVAFH